MSETDPKARPVILVSNDDGHQAAGIQALAAAMAGLGEVWVVAPEAEQSASSHAISIHRPLRIREVRPRCYAVDGTPTDCSYVGINHCSSTGARGSSSRASTTGRTWPTT